MEDFLNRKQEHKQRYGDLLLRKTGDAKAVEREMKRMAIEESEAKIDAGGK